MNKSITWLHLSDLHARKRGDWDLRRVTDALVLDLKTMQKEKGVVPDFIFFTGDAAFGAVSGDAMPDQYALVRTFLDSVRNAFTPPVPIRRIYIVPGNHDIDRSEITPGELQWLRDERRKLSDIIGNAQSVTKQWQLWMQRFDSYRNFLRSYGLSHIDPEDPHLTWADIQEVNGVRVGVTGFNSAWSAADNDDKGKLWAAMDFQIQKNLQKIDDTQLNFALIHHPGNWYSSQEDPSAMRALRRNFPVILHGHEHQEWVESDGDGRFVVSAGACYESGWMANGYNFGYINFESRSGGIWLRQWDAIGGGWVAKNVANKTKNEIWPLNGLDWIGPEVKSLHASAQIDDLPVGWKNGPLNSSRYTKIFCQNVVEQLDYLELFGCDIPRDLQRHQLSVAYVSLNITRPEILGSREDGGLSESRDSLQNVEGEVGEVDVEVEESRYLQKLEGSFSFEELIINTPSSGSRITILGPAGAGKSTLMRWCAIHAAKGILNGFQNSDTNREVNGDWRKIPFLVKLRDCKDGRLPSARNLPEFLAKHLPVAPEGWVTSLLSTGNAFILLDGVDEIHKDFRPQMALEIEELVKTYPLCSYIITSRQGAVASDWLSRVGFTEATVEPMEKDDRDEFIDKWFRSARLELQKLKPGEDLDNTAAGLKQELHDQPELGLLATNPLLCAMICALYRERQEKLPETPSEICEALVHMLLHRRERETPGMNGHHFTAEWRALQYSQKKSVVADLAWHMVSRGDSQTSTAEVLPIFQRAMAATPGRREGDAAEILRAAIERSGLLRPNGDDYISFLHNTLKEYLAAERAVENSDWKILVAHADDPAWQPVVLFALALGSESFSNNLIGGLFEKLGPAAKNTTRTRNRSKADQAKLTESNARAFFLVRGRKSAKRLSPELSLRIESLTSRLLPPAYMQDVEALAQLGHRLLTQSGDIFANPKWWASQDARMATRCLRLLRLIGGNKSRGYIASIQRMVGGSSLLTAEWMLACSELAPTTSVWPFHDKKAVLIDNTHVSDLGVLSKLMGLEIFSAISTKISDISVFSGMRGLQYFDVRSTLVRDIAPLEGHANLHTLSISLTPVDDFGPIKNLHSLKTIRARGSKVANLEPLKGLRSLKTLILDRTSISDVAPLGEVSSLEFISIKSTSVRDISPLFLLKNLGTLDLEGALVDSLEGVKNVASLKSLNVKSTQISDLCGVGHIKGLQKLVMGNTKISMLGDWIDGGLSHLDAAGSLISDVSPLSACKYLKTLNISQTPVKNLASLGNLSQLVNLNISNTDVFDYEPLRNFPKLRHLVLPGRKEMDISALETLDKLAMLHVVGPDIDEEELNRFLSLRPDVTVYAATLRRT